MSSRSREAAKDFVLTHTFQSTRRLLATGRIEISRTRALARKKQKRAAARWARPLTTNPLQNPAQFTGRFNGLLNEINLPGG